MKRILLALLFGWGLAGCGEVVVRAPDFGAASDPGQAPDTGLSDPGTEDPDGGTEDPGQAQDTGVTDVPLKDPQFAGEACRDPAECLSGTCDDGICTCADATHCPATTWCDRDPAKFLGSNRCFPLRAVLDGCTDHVQCASGACDIAHGLCVHCATGGTGCDDGSGTVCCFGECSQGCLGCALAPPPEPVRQRCLTGCYDPLTEYCGPEGPAAPLPATGDCNFQHPACASGICVPTQDGMDSECGCNDATADCPFEWQCVARRCVPPAM